MHDPVALPTEIIEIIYDYLNDDESSLPYLLRPQREAVRVTDLRAFSLVSRALHHRFTPKLYSRLQYTENRHLFSILWQFLRTIVKKPELGALVQHLDFREWQRDTISDSDFIDNREDQLALDELRALYDIGSRIGYTCRQLSNALIEVRRPFTVLLISCLPNVVTLYFSSTPVPLP